MQATVPAAEQAAEASVRGVVEKMDAERFGMLLDVLRILERSNSPQVAQTALEIIDSYDDRLTEEQKAAVLKQFLRFQSRERSAEKDRHFEDAMREEQSKALFRSDYL